MDKGEFSPETGLKPRLILGANCRDMRDIRRREHSGETIKPLLGKGNHRVVTTAMLFTGVELHSCHSQQGYPQVGENYSSLARPRRALPPFAWSSPLFLSSP